MHLAKAGMIESSTHVIVIIIIMTAIIQNVVLETEISDHESSVDRESVMDDDTETPLNNSSGSIFADSSDLETPGSTSTPISPGSIVCSAQCCDLAKPVQIRDKDAIRSRRKLQGNKWRQFSPDRYKSYPWLVLCTTRSKVLCSYCSSCQKRGLLTEKVVGGGDACILDYGI